MGSRGHWPRQGGGEGPILERSAGERFVAWPKIRGKRHEYSAGTSICLECEICVSKESGFTYMGSIDFANITLQACDKPTRISLSSSCSAFSLLISASSVCTSFTSTCNLFPGVKLLHPLDVHLNFHASHLRRRIFMRIVCNYSCNIAPACSAFPLRRVHSL